MARRIFIQLVGFFAFTCFVISCGEPFKEQQSSLVKAIQTQMNSKRNEPVSEQHASILRNIQTKQEMDVVDDQQPKQRNVMSHEGTLSIWTTSGTCGGSVNPFVFTSGTCYPSTSSSFKVTLSGDIAIFCLDGSYGCTDNSCLTSTNGECVSVDSTTSYRISWTIHSTSSSASGGATATTGSTPTTQGSLSLWTSSGTCSGTTTPIPFTSGTCYPDTSASFKVTITGNTATFCLDGSYGCTDTSCFPPSTNGECVSVDSTTSYRISWATSSTSASGGATVSTSSSSASGGATVSTSSSSGGSQSSTTRRTTSTSAASAVLPSLCLLLACAFCFLVAF